jgi:TRAP-type mannitol/chloroaromatic compound transport system permease large subunit
MEVGLFPTNLFQALPLRVFGIMQNDTLLAIPFFTFMGIILERSGMAEDLLETVGQVFGPLRGGLAVAVILVGALLAATTGVVAAAVISMGLISLPIMLRYGYNRTIATGTITASGHAGAGHPAFAGADRAGRPAGPLGGRHVRRRAAARACCWWACYLAFVAVVAIVGRPGCRRCRPKPASTAKRTAPAATVAAGAAGHLCVRPAGVGRRCTTAHEAPGWSRTTPARRRDLHHVDDRGLVLALVLALATGC